MFIYFSTAQVKNQDFKGPDVFIVLGVTKRERKCWVVWEEEKAPDVVIELLSDSTAHQDKGEKKQIYQDKLRVPEYFWYDPFNPDDWAGFFLNDGRYESLPSGDRGEMVSERLGLALVRWAGEYRGVNTVWLRWTTVEGELLATPQELTEEAQQRAEEAQQRAEEAQQRAEQLAARLRELGIDPEEE
jgi:hypothetical protein